MSYEAMQLETIAIQLLTALGEDPNREGLQDTPRRFAAFWTEFMEYHSTNSDTTFEVVTTDQMVIVSGIRVWSMCEHHLLPFSCDLAIAYIAQERVLGLSKFVRIAQTHAHKLQLQERLCYDIAMDIKNVTKTPDVAVIGRGRHLCMEIRGVKQGALATSSVLLGAFRNNQTVRQELLTLLPRDGE